MKSKPKGNALEILDGIEGNDPNLQDMIDEERMGLAVARLIHDARTAEKLTQKELARRVGTTQSVIARLEDADYRGHSLNMLRRVASALKRRVELRLVPE